ncbi:MAG: hypothetical protein ABI305_12450 [Tepidiformaceae bacterium]
MTGSFGPRIGALCGVAFALLLFLGVASINVPHSVSDKELIAWWAKSGNQTSAIASMYLVAASAVALVLFLSHLRERLNGESGSAGNAMFAVGGAAVGLLLTSAAVRGVIAFAVKTSDEPMPGVDVLRYFPQISYALISVALLAMGACLVLLAWAVVRAGVLPKWLAWASLALGLITLAGTPIFAGFMIPVVLIWAVVASIAVWRVVPAPKAAAIGPTSQPA